MTATSILLTTDTVGGVWTYALDLARALAGAGTRTLLVTMGPRPSPEQRAEVTALDSVTMIESDVPLDWLAPDFATVRAGGRAIARLARDHDVDLVQLHAAALADAEFAVPVVVVAHSCVGTWWDAVESAPLPAALAWRDAQTRAGLIAADAVVAPSAAFAEALQRVHRLPFTPAVVHNGRSAPASSAQATAHDAFTAGRLWDRGKNLRTLDKVAGTGIPIRAAGPLFGPQGETVTLHHIACLGSLTAAALAGELEARPVFVSAALYEPFGLSVLEAAQAGCALVLADVPTFRELWNGVATFINPRDAVSFADAIAALLNDPAERARRGEAASARAEAYSLQAMYAGIAKIHASLRGCVKTQAAA